MIRLAGGRATGGSMPLKRQRSLRQYLMAFGAALLAPVLVLAAVLVWQFTRAEQRQSEERGRAAAESIVAAVDRELAGLQAAGQALASSAALRAGDYERFQRRSLEVIRALRGRRAEEQTPITPLAASV